MSQNEAYETDGLYTVYEISQSPETGGEIPVVISWWHHPDPEHPEARAGAEIYRRFIQHTRMNEHMAHYLEGPGGESTYLSVTGTRGRMRNHPLDAALQEEHEMPVPDPIPYDFGHVLVHARMGMYVLVADPLPRQPTFRGLMNLVGDDPGSVGMARFKLRADDHACHHYREAPRSHNGVSEELLARLESEPDGALRRGLMVAMNVPHPDGRRGLFKLPPMS